MTAMMTWPKSGDSLNVFVADLGNAVSYVNAVRKNQNQNTGRRKDLAYYNGVASFEGLENNDVGQRWERNIVEHKGIGVMNHDEVDDDDTLKYDDQEVECAARKRQLGRGVDPGWRPRCWPCRARLGERICRVECRGG